MSNGPYGQIACDCGALRLLVCGSALGVGLDIEGQPVAFWVLDAIKLGQGADELDVTPDGRGVDSWRCRRYYEHLLFAHDEAGVAVLQGHPEDFGNIAPVLTPSQQGWLEELGYRMV